jgi:hypothetical protein
LPHAIFLLIAQVHHCRLRVDGEIPIEVAVGPQKIAPSQTIDISWFGLGLILPLTSTTFQLAADIDLTGFLCALGSLISTKAFLVLYPPCAIARVLQMARAPTAKIFIIGKGLNIEGFVFGLGVGAITVADRL